MRLLALMALTLLEGCAGGYPPQVASTTPTGARLTAQTPVINCSTTNIGIATLSGCGSDVSILSAAAE